MHYRVEWWSCLHLRLWCMVQLSQKLLNLLVLVINLSYGPNLLISALFEVLAIDFPSQFDDFGVFLPNLRKLCVFGSWHL